MNLKQRIINGLYGCCVADAAGNLWEFHSNINPDHVIRDANNCNKLVITDDSQMSIFSFEAIKNLDDFDGDIYEKVRVSFTESYLNWYRTQTRKRDPYLRFSSKLLNMPCMYSIQAPGNTCLSALRSLKNGQVVENDSKGAGSVMRLLPLVSFFENYSLEEVIKLAQITGNITHKHSENAVAIALYMTTAYNIINDLPVISKYSHVKHADEIGEGWTALEAVEIAIWAYTKSEIFDDVFRYSIAIRGDSDTTGAMCGVLFGLSGREVPQKYIDKLDALDAIKYVIENI